ncbi:mRNA interferase [Spirochaetia bacterium]|nr:mRNA interferase [Spirochaetia bacterium]
MVKGEIWWAALPPDPRGSEPGKKRPVLIVQGDELNRRALSTVICATITSNLLLAGSSPNILLEKGESGLPISSVINFSQILTIDRYYITKLVSMVSKPVLAKIDESLKFVFDL